MTKKESRDEKQPAGELTMMERIEAPTPSFFRKVRKIGLVLTAISGALLAAPVSLPPLLTAIAAYLGVAGTVATAISQTATETDGIATRPGTVSN